MQRATNSHRFWRDATAVTTDRAPGRWIGLTRRAFALGASVASLAALTRVAIRGRNTPIPRRRPPGPAPVRRAIRRRHPTTRDTATRAPTISSAGERGAAGEEERRFRGPPPGDPGSAIMAAILAAMVATTSTTARLVALQDRAQPQRRLAADSYNQPPDQPRPARLRGCPGEIAGWTLKCGQLNCGITAAEAQTPATVHGHAGRAVQAAGTATPCWTGLRQEGCLKARRPRPERGAWAGLVTLNSAGGVAGGDRLSPPPITAAPGTRLTVASQAAERYYRADSLGRAATRPHRAACRRRGGAGVAAAGDHPVRRLRDGPPARRAAGAATRASSPSRRWCSAAPDGRDGPHARSCATRSACIATARCCGTTRSASPARCRRCWTARPWRQWRPRRRDPAAGGARRGGRLDALRAALAPFEAGASAWTGCWSRASWRAMGPVHGRQSWQDWPHCGTAARCRASGVAE